MANDPHSAPLEVTPGQIALRGALTEGEGSGTSRRNVNDIWKGKRATGRDEWVTTRLSGNADAVREGACQVPA